MRCEQVIPYIPGFAGGDLRADTTSIVAEHIDGCASCRAQADRATGVIEGLTALAERDLEPPPYLLDAVLESAPDAAGRPRLFPIVPPSVPAEVVRVVQDNREAIAQAGAAAIVAAGAAYALWRAVRSRPADQPATS